MPDLPGRIPHRSCISDVRPGTQGGHMFETESTEPGVLTTGDMAAFLERLGAVGGESLDDAERGT